MEVQVPYGSEDIDVSEEEYGEAFATSNEEDGYDADHEVII